ncbi:ISAs1 family transposase [Listeria monocytogenes]
MDKLVSFLVQVVDERQPNKVTHSLADIVLLVFFAHLANCDGWKEIHLFALRYEKALKKVLPLENGLPSKDTIRRVIQRIHPCVFEEVNNLWNELLRDQRAQPFSRFVAIDGKTMCGNQLKTTKPAHIITAYSVEEGLCLGQLAVEEKSNEITAIPKLIKGLAIAGHTVTIDAMGTQRAIAKQIRMKRADYVLAVKGNQKLLYEEIKEYLDNERFEKEIKKTAEGYTETTDYSRGQFERREYYQTAAISWLSEKKKWSGLKTIGKVVTTIEKANTKTRYYISSCAVNSRHFQQAVRGHWGIESMHWHLDVTFKEDSNHTLNKNAARNLNILRKMSLPFLKDIPEEPHLKHTSLKTRRFWISLNVPYYLGVFYEMYIAR